VRGIFFVGVENPNRIFLESLLRRLFSAAGIDTPAKYSSHSLRRGFAGWARASGWDLKDLMAYVGWRDIKSAMRYLDTLDETLQAKFEQGLPVLPSAIPPSPALR
jgi:integrase